MVEADLMRTRLYRGHPRGAIQPVPRKDSIRGRDSDPRNPGAGPMRKEIRVADVWRRTDGIAETIHRDHETCCQQGCSGDDLGA